MLAFQAMRHLKERAAAPGSAATADEKEQYQKDCEDFLRAETAEAERENRAGRGAANKILRVKSYDILASIDWQLKITTGQGLVRFTGCPVGPRDAAACPVLLDNRPRLTALMDSDNNNCCVLGYAIGQKK